MESIADWVEWGFIGLLSIAFGWARTEHGKLSGKIESLEKTYSNLDKRMAVYETKMDSQKEHLDQRLDSIDKKMDKLFDRFDQYDRDREEFLKNYELTKRQ